MSVATRLLTYDDLLETPDDGQRYEIIGGELHVSPSPTPKHQRVLRNLFLLVHNYSQQYDSGEVFFAPLDTRFGPHDIVEPDLLYIRKDRLPIIAEKLIEGAPDLVVEVLSPSSRQRDRALKLDLYAREGVPEYWIADPERETLTVHALEGGTYRPLDASDGMISSRVLGGLTIDVTSLFSKSW